MNNNTFDWEKTSQMSIVQFLLAIFIPSSIAYLGFRVVLAVLVSNGLPVLIAWPIIASAMLFVLVIIAILLLNKEAKTLGISIWKRMCMKKLTVKEWCLYIVIIAVGLVVSLVAQNLVLPFMNAVHLNVPSYMPFFLNPAINPTTADMSIVSPGLPLRGSYGLLLLIGITLLLNILTEELYFRAWMLPKLSRYGE